MPFFAMQVGFKVAALIGHGALLKGYDVLYRLKVKVIPQAVCRCEQITVAADGFNQLPGRHVQQLSSSCSGFPCRQTARQALPRRPAGTADFGLFTRTGPAAAKISRTLSCSANCSAAHLQGQGHAEPAQGFLLVFMLRPALLAGHGHACRHMRQPHGAVGAVAVLAARPRSDIGIHAALLQQVPVIMSEHLRSSALTHNHFLHARLR